MGRRTNEQLRALSRREFVQVATVAAGSFALLPTIGCSDDDGNGDDSPDAGPTECDPASDSICLPTIGGAPDTHVGHVIAAFVDTIIPGRHRDPLGHPGGIDTNAPALFFDPELPAIEFVSLLAAYLDGTARRNFEGKEFTELTPEQRDEAVTIAIDGFEQMEFAVQLAKLAFYSSREAADYLGYPGANPGYYGDADFTFGVPMSQEITGDGNLP